MFSDCGVEAGGLFHNFGNLSFGKMKQMPTPKEKAIKAILFALKVSCDFWQESSCQAGYAAAVMLWCFECHRLYREWVCFCGAWAGSVSLVGSDLVPLEHTFDPSGKLSPKRRLFQKERLQNQFGMWKCYHSKEKLGDLIMKFLRQGLFIHPIQIIN